jgi:magnesium-transporting ATPase (P-type)
MLPLCYNAFWTSWPCIVSYSLDKDVDQNLSMNYPILYKAGQIGYYFNMKRFWMWIILSVLHGCITYFGTSMVFNYLI